MMEKLIKKEELARLILAHQSKLSQMQFVANTVLESGLPIDTELLHSLHGNKEAILKTANALAERDSQRFASSLKRASEKAEILEGFSSIIEAAAKELIRVTNKNGHRPLEIEAYVVGNNQVELSPAWLAQKESEHTIFPSEGRDKAESLVKAVQESVKALNAFVEHNPYFGSGLTSSQDNRRSLLWVDGGGNLHESKENYEFI
jgi:hypothetical protein